MFAYWTILMKTINIKLKLFIIYRLQTDNEIE